MLIELVRNHPVLYDKRHPKHKDSLLKDDLWGEIGSELGMNGMQAHEKFKNLKDTFTKHKNKIKGSMKSGAGAADVPTVK
ncbi:transcription factor Adf-1-like [Rhipicephalus microplus]|uniref:transcription factor Adf-1-like n=1 Tax=Rhipicephalus microplus TaxID=6941 RepID=UPI003F6D27FF